MPGSMSMAVWHDLKCMINYTVCIWRPKNRKTVRRRGRKGGRERGKKTKKIITLKKFREGVIEPLFKRRKMKVKTKAWKDLPKVTWQREAWAQVFSFLVQAFLAASFSYCKEVICSQWPKFKITKMVAKMMKGEGKLANELGQVDEDPALTRPDSWAVAQRGW